MKKSGNMPGQILLDGATHQEHMLQNAIDRVRMVHEAIKGEPIYGCFSGGKDSLANKIVFRLAAEKDNVPIDQYVDWNYNVTGIDPPELYYYIRDEHPDVQMHRYTESFWSLMTRKGPPTRTKRWCCQALKEGGGEGRMCSTGVRWEESINRAGNRAVVEEMGRSKQTKILFNDNSSARKFLETCALKRKRVVNPIIDWTAENVWDLIRAERETYCRLYDDGFTRLGCIGCPMSAKRADEFARWPGFRRLYLWAFDRHIQYRKVNNLETNEQWSTPEGMMAWYLEETNMDRQIDGQEVMDEWEERA